MERLQGSWNQIFKFLKWRNGDIFKILLEENSTPIEAPIKLTPEFIDNWYYIMNLLPQHGTHRPSSSYNFQNHTFQVDHKLFVQQRHEFVSEFKQLRKTSRTSINSLYALYIQHTGSSKRDPYQYLQRSNTVLTENIYHYSTTKHYKDLVDFFDWCYKYHQQRIPYDLQNKTQYESQIGDHNLELKTIPQSL